MSYKWLTGTLIGLFFVLAGSDSVYSQSERKAQQNDQEQQGEKDQDVDDQDENELGKVQRATLNNPPTESGPRRTRRAPSARNAPRAGVRGGNGETQTATDRQGRRTITMRVNEQAGILVEVAIDYGPNDKDELIRKHPDLSDYVELFPQQVGEHQVELSIKIRSQYRAKTPEELKAKHPNAFNLMRRYYKNKR